MSRLEALEEHVTRCRRCPRLVTYREEVARTRKRAHLDETYWGRPVPGFGDSAASIVLVGLAPAAHGANRTGRMFTGDGTDGGGASDFLMRAMYATDLASSPTSSHVGDGLQLHDAFLTAICRCAPPANKPTRPEIVACTPWLAAELDLLPVRVLVCLGKLSWDHSLRMLRDRGAHVPRPRPGFAHAAEFIPAGEFPHVLASYHPSRQNTATKRLTPTMLEAVLRRARTLAGLA